MRGLFSTLLFVILFQVGLKGQNKIVVFQSDFGLKDGAVSAMKGVAMGVSTDLKLFDLTHEIPAYNIWEAAYRLEQTVPYWPDRNRLCICGGSGRRDYEKIGCTKNKNRAVYCNT